MEREEDEQPIANTTVRQAILDDVNMLKDGEDVDAYEDFNSGRSDGEDDLEDMADPRGFLDDDIEPREYPNDADLLDEEVALVDDAFDESLGGSLDIDRIDKETLRATAWGEPCSAFESDLTSYPHLSDDGDVAESPLSIFFYYMPKSWWVHIKDEANRYRKQNIDARASRMRANQVRMHRPTTPETLQQQRRRLRA
ncbi:hypothetical protein L914_01875 [Phytophthora nicotianae]|uniref:PiggyBac transposable element-derived protein domain-containing protein n=2 Tax=Phytophthora nicotianae TaxID=4792 RepID=V9FUY7_PHYNI|nr:hypothetical protein F443_01982 [Phytophthora nicotianae P1569]ETM54843.1 hypothetical protein L914_01875 [Phytophthora nicotianae]